MPPRWEAVGWRSQRCHKRHKPDSHSDSHSREEIQNIQASRSFLFAPSAMMLNVRREGGRTAHVGDIVVTSVIQVHEDIAISNGNAFLKPGGTSLRGNADAFEMVILGVDAELFGPAAFSRMQSKLGAQLLQSNAGNRSHKDSPMPAAGDIDQVENDKQQVEIEKQARDA